MLFIEEHPVCSKILNRSRTLRWGEVKWDNAKNDDIGSVHRLTPRSRGPDKELFPEYHARNSVLAFVSRSSIRS